MRHFQSIGLAKEKISPENPGALEKRVALIPKDVKRLVQAGYRVSVEKGAGEGVGFKDTDYERVGATLESGSNIYTNKDLIIKFKGPSTEDLGLIRPHATLFCMAHVQSIPERLAKCREREINLIAMEKIVESPEAIDDITILGYMAMEAALNSIRTAPEFRILIVGYSERMAGAIVCAARSQAASICIIQATTQLSDLPAINPHTLVFYDAGAPVSPKLIKRVLEQHGQLFDLAAFESKHPANIKKRYLKEHPLKTTGKRRIECLHETGQAGARYGLALLRKESPLQKPASQAVAVILGYGNVGQGSIHECFVQGVSKIFILGRHLSASPRIEPFLGVADIVINAAEPLAHERTVTPYLVTNQHAKHILPKGSVVVDLIGGSKTNRSPVENVIECTFLTDPYFIEDDIFFTALWGWPMMGMMRETAIRYSSQIASVLLDKEKLLDGFETIGPGLKPAIMAGIYR